MRVKRRLPLFCISLLALLALPANALVISGSDLFGEGVRDALEVELEAAGLEAEITFDGSLLGLRDLEEGTVDASLLAIPEGSAEETSLRKFPVAYQIVACAVHATNPVTELTYDELVNLYRDNGTIEDWSQLTLDPTWADRKVTLMASRRANAITLELFNAIVLKGDRLKPSVRYIQGTDAELLATIVEDPTVLLLTPAIRVEGPVKLLAIRKTETDQGYTPSIDNVFFGDYPLRLPFYLVVSEAMDRETIGMLLTVLYSDAVTEALEAASSLPVPELEQRSMLRQF